MVAHCVRRCDRCTGVSASGDPLDLVLCNPPVRHILWVDTQKTTIVTVDADWDEIVRNASGVFLQASLPPERDLLFTKHFGVFGLRGSPTGRLLAAAVDAAAGGFLRSSSLFVSV